MVKRYGLIGYPLGHSFSKRFFTEKFENLGIRDSEYDLYPIEQVDQILQLLQNEPTLRGLNVTIPHKVSVMPFLDEVEESAGIIGAVNCIQITRAHGTAFLKGYNTDVIGFERSLVPLLRPYHSKALILGTGGAANAVKYVLEKLSIPYLSISRHQGDATYEEVDHKMIADHKLIINTTPLGMHPNEHEMPRIPLEMVGEQHLIYDLIYNPAETRLMKESAARGAMTKNGLDMLVLQAEASWEIWNK